MVNYVLFCCGYNSFFLCNSYSNNVVGRQKYFKRQNQRLILTLSLFVEIQFIFVFFIQKISLFLIFYCWGLWEVSIPFKESFWRSYSSLHNKSWFSCFWMDSFLERILWRILSNWTWEEKSQSVILPHLALSIAICEDENRFGLKSGCFLSYSPLFSSEYPSNKNVCAFMDGEHEILQLLVLRIKLFHFPPFLLKNENDRKPFYTLFNNDW